jgi:FkbM family methyltransferase
MIKRVNKKWKDYLKTALGLYGQKSYSQEGEDLVLDRIFGGKKHGFYVDVGAHHPKRFSNTYLFYKRNWMGINIDAMPGSMELFKRFRSRDINLELAIAIEPGTRTYFFFNEPALNGFDPSLSYERHSQEGPYKIIGRQPIETVRLEHVLENYVPVGRTIDFITIDTEGLDFEVLQSNDWERFSPRAVLIEILGQNLDDILTSDASTFLCSRGFDPIVKLFNTIIFLRD